MMLGENPFYKKVGYGKRFALDILEKYRDVRFTMDTLTATFLEEIPDGFRMIIEYKEHPAYFSTRIKVIPELFAPMKKQVSES